MPEILTVYAGKFEAFHIMIAVGAASVGVAPFVVQLLFDFQHISLRFRLLFKPAEPPADDPGLSGVSLKRNYR